MLGLLWWWQAARGEGGGRAPRGAGGRVYSGGPQTPYRSWRQPKRQARAVSHYGGRFDPAKHIAIPVRTQVTVSAKQTSNFSSGPYTPTYVRIINLHTHTHGRTGVHLTMNDHRVRQILYGRGFCTYCQFPAEMAHPSVGLHLLGLYCSKSLKAQLSIKSVPWIIITNTCAACHKCKYTLTPV